MKIGVMLRHLPTERGGIGRYTEEVLRNLLRIDDRNDYFLFHMDAPVGSYSEYRNVREFSESAPSRLQWDQIVVPRLAKSCSLDLVFSPKISVPLRMECRTVVTMHGADWFAVPESYSPIARIYHTFAARLYAREADAIIAASHDASRKLEYRIPAARGKTVAVHHGVDRRFRRIDDDRVLARVKTRYELPDQFFLFVGRIYPMKNVRGIIAAYARLRGRIPHKLVLVGSRGPRAERELAAIREYGLEDDIVLAGRVPDEDLPAIYSLGDAFLFPSLYEGFGIPLLEAMACGCPVVTSVEGACPEVVGNAAVLVDPRDVEAIAAAAFEVATDTDLANRLKVKGLARARTFTWEHCAAETLAVFEKVMKRPVTHVGREPDLRMPA